MFFIHLAFDAASRLPLTEAGDRKRRQILIRKELPCHRLFFREMLWSA